MQGRKWQKMLQHEREQRIQLEEMVGQLAREQTVLEQASKPSENETNIPGIALLFLNKFIIFFLNDFLIFLLVCVDTSSEDENTEFYDAQGGEVESSSVSSS